MDDPAPEASGPRHLGGPTTGPPPGLCGACLHSRLIRTARGTTFRLCERSSVDVRFRRYPPLPVLDCPGFERGHHA